MLAVALTLLVIPTGCGWGKKEPVVVQPYLLTPDEAQTLGMSVGWKSVAAVSSSGEVDSLRVFGDQIIVTETGANILSAIDARSGLPMWEAAVGDPYEPLLGVASAEDTVVALTRSEALQYDAANGRRLQFDRLGEREPATTAPLLLWPFAVYGTPDGRAVFHHLPTGLMKSAYLFDGEVQQAPLLWEDLMVVITRGGYINAMIPDPNGARRLWQKRVFDDVVVPPARTPDALLVASTDGSMWAFAQDTGRVMWRWQTEFPMRDAPKVYDNAVVYQGIDGYGFAAVDVATGLPIWVNEEVTGGTVLTRIRNELIVWNQDGDGNGGTFTRLDAGTGRVVGTVRSRDIAFAATSAPEAGTIFGVSRNGNMISLNP